MKPVPVPLELYVGGFREAALRFGDVGDDWQRGFVALYEVVAWSGSIRWFLHQDERDRVKRECSHLEGIYFVRNQMLKARSDLRDQSDVLGEADVLAEAVGDEEGASLATSISVMPPTVWTQLATRMSRSGLKGPRNRGR